MAGSEPPQQTVDIFPLERRAVDLAGAAAQFVEDFPGPLDIRFRGDLDVLGRIGAGTRQRPAQGIIARTVAPSPSPWMSDAAAAAEKFRQLAQQGAGPLRQLVEAAG